MYRAGVNCEEELRKRDEHVYQQEQENKIQSSRYNKNYKYIRSAELPSYLKRESRIARKG